jgi:long-chain acyl-CoA synthetase
MPKAPPNLQTLPELIADKLRVPRERAFGERRGAPQWRYTSSTRMLERAAAIACALRDVGIAAGERVALISNNRTDWIAAEFGILFAGCVTVPTFATLALDQLDYIFKDAETKLAFVETPADAERIRNACPNAPRFIHFDGEGGDSLAGFEAAGARSAAADPSRVGSFTAGTGADELAVLIYTSGTTGTPKGVMLTHRNLVANSYDSFEYGFRNLKAGDEVLSVLPFAHIYEHNDLLGFIRYDCQLHITQPDFLLDDLRSVRPYTMAFVPRIYERVLAAIVAKAKAEGGLKAKLVPWALEVGREYMTCVVDGKRPSLGLRFKYPIAKKLVLSKIRPALGIDRALFFISGSAPLHRDVALTFLGFGLPICEGYGLTETSPVVTVNRLGEIRYGSVGRPIPEVEVKIAEDGEILVKGPNVMKGYYHLEGEQPFTADRFFKTGDIGRIDGDGYLWITDRKKELIKTAAGKYVAPSRVESAIKRSHFVGQVFVLGDGRPYPIALVAANWDLIRRDFGIAATVPPSEIAERQDVREFIRKEVAEHTADLAPFEQVRRVGLLPRDLTIEEGELSPTLKVKRRIVEQRYADLIAAVYAPGQGS